jgi:hypothetical protein
MRISDKELEFLITTHSDKHKHGLLSCGALLDLRDARNQLKIAKAALEEINDACCYQETLFEHEIKKQWCSQRIARQALEQLK